MEEAATPLPSEETTPPVTNIYFGAIRMARAVTRFTAPDFSYLSGRPTITCRGVRGFSVCITNPEIQKSGLANPEYERQRTNNYGREALFCQFQLFAPPHLKFFWPRNLFIISGFDSSELRRPATLPVGSAAPPCSCPKYGNVYSYFFGHKLYRVETHGKRSPSNLVKSFRHVSGSGFFRCERPR